MCNVLDTILVKDKESADPKYGDEVDIGDKSMTVLQMAALRNLPATIKIILKHQPDILYLTCRCLPKMPQMNALEVALEKRCDDAAALLISKMAPKRYNSLNL